MANINTYSSKLVWPSNPAGEHVSGKSGFIHYNMYFIVTYGKKSGAKTDEFYLFSYVSAGLLSAGSAKDPEIIQLKNGECYNHRGLVVSTSNWSYDGNDVSFNLSINFKDKDHPYDVSGTYK